MNVGPPELVIVLVWVVAWVVPIWAIFDAARHTEVEFDAVGQSRLTWIVLLIVTALLCGPIGTIYAIYYLFAVRPKLPAVTGT